MVLGACLRVTQNRSCPANRPRYTCWANAPTHSAGALLRWKWNHVEKFTICERKL
jgi:hypothetical protein